MSLFVVGLNSESHNVSVREKYALLEEEFVKFNKLLMGEGFVDEIVTLSTCNRIEHYIYSTRSPAGVIARIFDTAIRDNLLFLKGQKASHHLFEVVSGLKSQIIGESEILGQIKKAYSISKENNLTGKYLNSLFQKAIHVGKKVRTQTDIGKLSLSTGGIVIDKIKAHFEDISAINVLLIGIGDISRSVASSLYKKGARNIFVSNRLVDKGLVFSKEMEASYVPLNELYPSMKKMDVIISSTTAPHYLITEEHKAYFKEGKKLFVDLAVPRDIKPTLEGDSSITLINIDKIETISRVNDTKRRSEIAKVQELLSIENCIFCTGRLYKENENDCISSSIYDVKELRRWHKNNFSDRYK